MDLSNGRNYTQTPSTLTMLWVLHITSSMGYIYTLAQGSSRTLLTYHNSSAAAGIAPYMALELGVFDLMPRDLPPFVRGFSSAFMATTLCYPLDTVRCGARHSCL